MEFLRNKACTTSVPLITQPALTIDHGVNNVQRDGSGFHRLGVVENCEDRNLFFSCASGETPLIKFFKCLEVALNRMTSD